MPNRYIMKPAELEANEKPYGLTHFLFAMLEKDQRFQQDGEGLRARVRIEHELVKRQSDSFVELADKDWQRLHQACEQPTEKRYPISPASACLGFLEAVRVAGTTPPTVVDTTAKLPPAEVPTATASPRAKRKKRRGSEQRA